MTESLFGDKFMVMISWDGENNRRMLSATAHLFLKGFEHADRMFFAQSLL
jgi:hypothetical protein